LNLLPGIVSGKEIFSDPLWRKVTGKRRTVSADLIWKERRGGASTAESGRFDRVGFAVGCRYLSPATARQRGGTIIIG
jgi:hypothetical protein